MVLIVSLFLSAGLSAETITFYLQPYKGTQLFVNNVPTRFRVIKKDKSLGHIRLNIKTKPNEKYTIKIAHKAFKPISYVISQDEIKRFNNRDHFFVLDRIDSKYQFIAAYKTGQAPKSVTFIDNNRVVAPSLGGRGAHVINIETGQTTEISPPKKWARRRGFVESLVIAEHDELWLSQMHTGRIHVFKLSTLEYQATVKLRGSWPKVMLYDASRDVIFVSNWGTMSVSMVDRKKRKDVKRIKVYGTPRGMQLSDDKNFLYVTQFSGPVANDISGRLIKVNLKTRKIVKRLGIRGAKRHIIHDYNLNRFYTSDMARRTVEAFDKGKDKAVAKVKVYANPNTIVWSKQHNLIYVSSRGRNHPEGYHKVGYDFGKISVIDTKTFKVIEQIEGGNQPTGLDISANGQYIVFSDFLDNRIRIYKYVGGKVEKEQAKAELDGDNKTHLIEEETSVIRN